MEKNASGNVFLIPFQQGKCSKVLSLCVWCCLGRQYPHKGRGRWAKVSKWSLFVLMWLRSSILGFTCRTKRWKHLILSSSIVIVINLCLHMPASKQRISRICINLEWRLIVSKCLNCLENKCLNYEERLMNWWSCTVTLSYCMKVKYYSRSITFEDWNITNFDTSRTHFQPKVYINISLMHHISNARQYGHASVQKFST